MRIRNSSRVGFSLLSPRLLHPGSSSFAPHPSGEKPEEAAKQHLGDLRGPLQEGETDGDVHRQKNQMLTARGLEDRSIIFDADRSRSSLIRMSGGGASTIMEQAWHKKEKKEGRLNITGERSSRRRRDTNTKNSGAQLSQGDARWMEGEAVIPLKKRKAISFGDGVLEEVIMEKETKANTCSKKRKKTPCRKRIADEEEARESHDEATDGAAAKKHGARNSKGSTGSTALMEGSRCSRINGRGWRCCQQTLVGYSLCEHHLGKGRLRSMSVDHGDAKSCTDIGLYSTEEKETISSKNKRRKLGTVKARSISSLLHQTPHTTPNYPSAHPLILSVDPTTAAAATSSFYI